MESSRDIIILIGLGINFLTMIIGGGSLLFAIFRFSINNERRMATLETHIAALLEARNHLLSSCKDGKGDR